MKEKQIVPETEISFTGEVPLLPNVRPVIILMGSDYDMGYQCYQQLIQVFGPWVLDGIAHNKLTEDELAKLKTFQWNIRQHMPEFIEFFKGLAAGATDAGIPISYQQVLATFDTTGSHPAVPPVMEDDGLPPVDCSGWAAWGSATKDGKLICGGQQESAMRFAVTIIAFPDNGNSYIHSVSSMPGTQYLRSPFPFWGFPSMNNKGLVYVHHGNTGAALNRPIEGVTYGIPMGMQLIHSLRFANNSTQALTRLGVTKGGGFWADISGNAFAIENVENPFAIRQAGYAGENDFLYATNNWFCRELAGIGFCQGELYVPHAGWADITTGTPGGRNLSLDSIERNLGMWNLLHNYHGEVDLDFAKMTWRFPAQTPDGGFEIRICNLNSSLLGIVVPDDGDEGVYYVSSGCPARVAYTSSPSAHSFLVAPTFSFYQLQLAAGPDKVTTSAMYRAQHDLHHANQELRKLTYWDFPYAPLDDIYNKAVIEWYKGSFYQSRAMKTTGHEYIYELSKATRAFTRCQAFAGQVSNALVPPATSPEELGLRPWFGDWGEWATK
jgi:hypothetical protein